MEIKKTGKTLFGRYMSKVRRDVLSERLIAAKAEAKEEELDIEKAKVELSPNNEETKFIALKRIYDEIEANTPECLKFLTAPGYSRFDWIDASLRVWDEKYLPIALRETKDAAHWTPVQALVFMKTQRDAKKASIAKTKTAADVEAAKAARKERKEKQRQEQKAAKAAKEPERVAAREARKTKAASKKGGNNGNGGKTKKKKG